MVVTDDKINPFLVGVCDLIHGFDSAIQRNNQRAALLLRRVDSFVRDTISFRVTVRDIIDHIIRLRPQERIHQRHSRRAVHVVIAIDHDPLMRIYCAA